MALAVIRNHPQVLRKDTGTTQVLLPPFDIEANLVSSSSSQNPCQALTQPQAFFPKHLPRDTQAIVPQLLVPNY